MPRRILRLDNGSISVAREAHFDSEAQLHRLIALHPEVLPAEDVGMGPLVALANELDCGAGPMDLLATDAQGRLVIIEFKRGTENPDVRKLVAQVLDYGSSLWRTSYDEFERQCRACAPGFPGSVATHVEDRLRDLGESFDEEAFRAGIARCLDAGPFVFLCVGRNLDERTRRIMTYLAEGARMTFFAVEVVHFHAGSAHTSVLVPRTAFVPSWISAPFPGDPATLETATEETRELARRLDALAIEMQLRVDERRTGRAYLPETLEPVQYASSGVGVYATSRGMEVNLSVFKYYDEAATAEQLLAAIESVTGSSMRKSHDWPSVPCASVVRNWDRTRKEILVPYFRARAAHAAMSPVPEIGGLASFRCKTGW
jgi:hypothetical protein